MKTLFILLFFAVCIQSSTAQNKNSKQYDIAAITSAREASNKSIAKHDIDGIAKYWLTDFVQIRGNSTSLTGKDTIISTWKELFKTNPTVVYVRNPEKIIISDNDSLAWETGSWMAKNSYSNGGNYSAMWKKRDGVWRLKAELFVSLK